MSEKPEKHTYEVAKYIRENMKKMTEVRPTSWFFSEYIERANDILKSRYVAFIIKISRYDEAVVIPRPIWGKHEINVRNAYYEAYYKVYGKVILVNHDLIRGMLSKLSVKNLIYHDMNTYTLDTNDPETRKFIYKLMVWNALYDFLWQQYKNLWQYDACTLGYARNKMWNDFKDAQSFDELLRIISRKSIETLKSFIAKLVENKTKWLDRKVELHHIVLRMASQYVENIIYDPYMDNVEAKRYLRLYGSYIEYDGKTIRFKTDDTDSHYYLALLGGYEDTEKFVRIKVDVLGYKYDLKFKAYGSWIIGFDKLTHQPFAISLPYQCVNMPIKPCVEYIYGLRQDNLAKRFKEPVEINEV
jgi:hypothetical protein